MTRKVIEQHLTSSIETKQKLLAPAYMEQIEFMATKFTEAIQRGGKLMFCGNGGSAADAQHLAAELVIRLRGSFNRGQRLRFRFGVCPPGRGAGQARRYSGGYFHQWQFPQRASGGGSCAEERDFRYWVDWWRRWKIESGCGFCSGCSFCSHGAHSGKPYNDWTHCVPVIGGKFIYIETPSFRFHFSRVCAVGEKREGGNERAGSFRSYRG